MANAIPVQTDELAVSLARRVQENRADLIHRYRQSLQENLFTNRSEVRPRELSDIAEGEADALINALLHLHLGAEHGAKLCQMGLSEQTILGLSHATRQFILAVFESDLLSQAMDTVDIYQNMVICGFIQTHEKRVLAEQEQIRGALQIAIGRYTIEIKDIQAMAQKATEASEFKTRFIARVSHELRTPLGALLGISEMLLQSIYGPLTPAQMDIIQRIINNTHTLEHIFTELLDQTQIESGELRLREDEFSPQALVQTVHANNLPLALKKGLTMQIEINSALPNSIIGDRKRIEQILSNLIINAIKYTHTGGIEIYVSTEGAEQWVMRVKDTGIGISKDNLAHIFEPFRQVDETIGGTFGGVGLGLAIVQQLVTAMKGTVTVESKVAQGSTFIVTLPLRTTKTGYKETHPS